MSGWPYNESDEMEIGSTGWVPFGESKFINKHTRHIIDEFGREFDENGNMIFDPNEENDIN